MITLQDITTDNFDQCLELTVHDEQKECVATNANSLAHAWLFQKRQSRMQFIITMKWLDS